MRKICGYILSLIFGLSFRFWTNPSLYSSSVNTHFCCQQDFTFCLSALEADSQCFATLTWNHCVVHHIHCPEYCEVNNHTGICFMFSVEVEKFFGFFEIATVQYKSLQLFLSFWISYLFMAALSQCLFPSLKLDPCPLFNLLMFLFSFFWLVKFTCGYASCAWYSVPH